MSLTALEETNINALLVSMFNSSAADYFQTIENFFLANGNDISLLAEKLGTNEIFESQFSGLSNEEKAESMLQRFGLTNDGTVGSAGSVAYTFFLQSIEGGISQSDILLAASDYLKSTTARDPLFNDTAKLLDNKASLAKHFSDSGVGYGDGVLAVSVLTVVTLDSNSVLAAKAIVSLLPTGAATVTAEMQAAISNIVDNVKSILTTGTTDSIDSVTSYLESVGTQLSTSTPSSFAAILTAANSVTTSALTYPTIIENLETLAISTIDSADNIEAIIQALIDDATAPTLDSSTPDDNATAVLLDSNIVLTFNEDVKTGTGNISIRRTSDDALFESISVTSDQVSITGAVVTVNPASNLLASTEYYVQIDATAIQDTSANNYAGIADTTSLSFTVATPSTPSTTFTANKAAFNTANAADSTQAIATSASGNTINTTDAQISGSTVNGVGGTNVLNITDQATAANFGAATSITNINTLNFVGGSTTITTPNIATLTVTSSAASVILLGNVGQSFTGTGNFVDTLSSGSSTGTLDGGGGTDVIKLVNGDNISGATLSNFETLDIASNGFVTMKAADFITLAAGTTVAGGNEQVTFSDVSTSLVDEALIEQYVLADGVNTFTQSQAGTTNSTGGTGAETINVGAGAASLTGGAGTDTFTVSAGASTITDVGAGNLVDIIDLNGGTVAATVTGDWTASAATDNGGANAAAFSIAVAGTNLVDLSSSGTSTFGYTVISTGTGAITGSDDADTLTNTSGNATFTGGDGIDTFTGTAGVLTIADLGVTGDVDVVDLNGGTVAATVTGNWAASASTDNGGANAAAFSIAVAGTHTVDLSSAGTSAFGYTVTSTGTGAITGTDDADTLTNSSGNATFTGGDGIDTFTGTAGVLTILDLGVAGDVDVVDLNGGTVAATVTGNWTANASTDNGGADNTAFTINTSSTNSVDLSSAGTSVAGYTVTSTGTGAITGSSMADVISTAAGASSITGGAGGDTISAGAGVDTFIWAAGVADTVAAAADSTGLDWITDLNINGAGGVDRLNLTATVATVHTTVTGTISEATFIADLNTLLAVGGGAGFDTDTANGISAALIVANAGDKSGKTYLAVDLDFDDAFTAADFIIDVTGLTGTLDTGDFM
jgi:hypothetical protein